MAPQLRCLTTFVHLGKIGTSHGLLLIAKKQLHWTHFRSVWGHLLALLLLRRISAVKIANATIFFVRALGSLLAVGALTIMMVRSSLICKPATMGKRHQ